MKKLSELNISELSGLFQYLNSQWPTYEANGKNVESDLYFRKAMKVSSELEKRISEIDFDLTK